MLSGRLAVITGATGGIGLETARSFVERGATVLLCSRKLDRAEKAAGEIGSGAIAEQLDITSSDSVRRFVAKVSRKYRGLDILVNNAATQTEQKSLTDISTEQ